MTPTKWTVELASVPVESRTGDCAAKHGGYVCTLTPGHAGRLHVSHGQETATVWERKCPRFEWDQWSDVIIAEQQCKQCGKREREHAA
jgi:hypothetical protein